MRSLRDLPRVDVLVESEALAAFPRQVRLAAARASVERLRALTRSGSGPKQGAEELAVEIATQILAPSLRPVINASGVILHTGAGRARLPQAAVEEINQVAGSHANLELDLESGKRGDRQVHVRALLKQLTGCEDAFVVNNCASAVFLMLHALANRKEVILSRGQMVEIGGSFRLPDIVRQSGCKLVEIGATNKTRLEDYKNAITARTAMLLRCHPSNFKVVGFTEEPPPRQLSTLAKEHGLIFADDVGSGCLVDTAQFGLPHEPTLQESIEAGADIVTASGDKLLGGPQAGILLGRQEAIKKIRKNPLARVVRIDKLSLAALEATLRLYATGQEAEIPVLRYLSRDLSEIEEAAEQLRQAYQGEGVVCEGITEVGGGSMPGTGIKTFRAGLKSARPERLAADLRKANPPILSRIQDDLVWLDARTLEDGEVLLVSDVLRGMANGA